MSNTRYRVDRSTRHDPVPCGMGSIIYLGNSLRQARQVFDLASAGVDPWNDKRSEFGVVLSEWSTTRLAYVVQSSKFPFDDFSDIKPSPVPQSIHMIHDPWGLSRLD